MPGDFGQYSQNKAFSETLQKAKELEAQGKVLRPAKYEGAFGTEAFSSQALLQMADPDILALTPELEVEARQAIEAERRQVQEARRAHAEQVAEVRQALMQHAQEPLPPADSQ